jgi:hypothetical protein
MSRIKTLIEGIRGKGRMKTMTQFWHYSVVAW